MRDGETLAPLCDMAVNSNADESIGWEGEAPAEPEYTMEVAHTHGTHRSTLRLPMYAGPTGHRPS